MFWAVLAPGLAVSVSSAVPVLPATTTPGIWAAVPVPSCTTAIIICCTSCATRGLVTCTNCGFWSAASVGIGRFPPIAIVAATSAISSGVVSTSPCPIAEEPTAVAPPILLAEGIVLSSAPAIEDGWSKPNRCAVATSRRRAELDPERGEHRVAGDGERVEQRPPAGLAARVLEREAADVG